MVKNRKILYDHSADQRDFKWSGSKTLKKDVKKLLLILLIGTWFMTTIYFLFSFLLKVQVPRFFLF